MTKKDKAKEFVDALEAFMDANYNVVSGDNPTQLELRELDEARTKMLKIVSEIWR